MNITFERESFLPTFQTAAQIAPARSPKPILQNVKLEINGEKPILTATDMEIGVRLNVEGVAVKTPGSVVLPVLRFGNLLRESSDEKIQIESDGKGTIVKGAHSRFKLTGENPDEFPAVSSFEEKDYLEIESSVFKKLIRRTLFATDTESSRYALGGVLLEFEKGNLIAVGTDGRRLAKMEGAAEQVGSAKKGDSMTIVPTKSMQMVERALPDDETKIRIATRSNDVLISIPQGVIYSRLVEGRFPKWRDVFPKDRDSMKLELPVGPVYSALRQAAVVASEESRGIDFTFGDGSLVMANNTAEVGESRIEMPISYDGDSIQITLDNRYFAEFLKVLDPASTFTLDVEGPETAAVCRTDDGYGYVIMPLSRS